MPGYSGTWPRDFGRKVCAENCCDHVSAPSPFMQIFSFGPGLILGRIIVDVSSVIICWPDANLSVTETSSFLNHGPEVGSQTQTLKTFSGNRAEVMRPRLVPRSAIKPWHAVIFFALNTVLLQWRLRSSQSFGSTQ